MSDDREGDRLFRAVRESTPALDEEAGRARFLASAQKRRSRGGRLLQRVSLAAAAMIAIAGLTIGAFLIGRRPVGPSATPTNDGLLRVWLATDKNEMPISFAEGSRVVILPDSRGRVEKMSDEGASFLIERGEVRAHVVHRDHTDWRFLAGPFEVEVTGTLLDVAWDPTQERLSVRVDEGAVVVRGPELGAQQVVRAGERCDVDLHAHAMHVSSTSPSLPTSAEPMASARESTSASPTEITAMSGVPSASHSAAAPSVPWTTFEERGDYAGAYAAAESVGLASLYRASSADELLRLAQVAQVSGHRDAERAALLALRQRFPDGEPSAVAAYELGRAASPSESITWFETYLRQAPQGPLAREALGRILEAQAASGDEAAARDAAKRYLERFPNGPEATLAHRLADGAHP